MTKRELKGIVKAWQPRLDLDGWDIDIQYLKSNENNDSGMIYWFHEFAKAQILLDKNEKDLEHTIVHELLHLMLEGHQDGPNKYNKHYERKLNKLAEELLGRKTYTEPGFIDETCKRKR